jgi:hypothetical protein
MQSAETVLNVIRERGRAGLPLQRLYRQLFNQELFRMAYGHIYSNKGSKTPGVTGETVDGMSLAKIAAIIDALRRERYRWSPAKRVYIPKEDREAPVGFAAVVGQTGRRGGTSVVRGVLRRPVLRPVPRFPPRPGLSHRVG